MKFCVVLVLCLAGVLAEKKINLEDIENDNLQSEAKSEAEDAQPEEAKYNSDKAESNNHLEYRTEARLGGGQQPQENKYVVQPEAYARELQAYQQQQQQAAALLAAQQQQAAASLATQQQQAAASLAAQQQQGPQQFYTPGYQTEALYQNQQNAPEISYQPQLSQGLVYQAEIPIGNQIQSYQQKIASQKFSQGIIGKANQYASGTQQLFYYPTQSTVPSAKYQVQPLLHQLAGHAAKNVELPAYTVALNQGSKISYQLQPQIQYVYEPQYVQPANPTHAPKNAQESAYATQQTYVSPQAYSGLTYTPQSSVYTQPKLSYTQAYYVQPPLLQYYQRPAFTPAVGNSLSYTNSKQPYYVSSNLAQQLAAQISEQQGSRNYAQDCAKIPGEPREHLSPPQLSAQNFKNGPTTQLRPVQSAISYVNQDYVSGPKSLLDSYTPSYVIAAQDTERYREIPLRLENGFLPSRGSYVHSYNQKRKTESV